MRVKPGCRRTDAADAMCSAMPFHNFQPFEAVSDGRGGKKLAYGDETSRLHSWSLSLPFLPSLLAGISVVHDISASAPLHYSRRLDWPVFRIQLSESLRLPWYVLVRVDDLLFDAITLRNLLTRNLHLRPYVPKALQRFWLSLDSGSICMHLGASDKGCALGREHHPIHWNMHSRFR